MSVSVSPPVGLAAAWYGDFWLNTIYLYMPNPFSLSFKFGHFFFGKWAGSPRQHIYVLANQPTVQNGGVSMGEGLRLWLLASVIGNTRHVTTFCIFV